MRRCSSGVTSGSRPNPTLSTRAAPDGAACPGRPPWDCRGRARPQAEYLANTLTKEFGLNPLVHEEFVKLFLKNCKYLDILTWQAGSTSWTPKFDRPSRQA